MNCRFTAATEDFAQSVQFHDQLVHLVAQHRQREMTGCLQDSFHRAETFTSLNPSSDSPLRLSFTATTALGLTALSSSGGALSFRAANSLSAASRPVTITVAVFTSTSAEKCDGD